MRLNMKRAILAKAEVTYGTDPTPTGAANAMEVYDPSLPALEHTKKERMPVRPFFGADRTVVGNTPYKLDFAVMLTGAGAAGTAPPFAALLKACRLNETINAGVDVTYTPDSGPFGSVTLYDNLDGVLHKGTGCRGTLQVEFAHGDIPMAKLGFTGIHAAPADTALPALTMTAWQDGLIMNKTNTQVTLHGETPVVTKLSIDLGNEVNWQDYVNTAEEVRMTGGKVTGSITMEADTMASQNWFALAAAGTPGALQLIHGTVAGNKVQIDAAAVQILDPKYEDADGVLTITATLNFLPSDAGNDEVSFKFL